MDSNTWGLLSDLPAAGLMVVVVVIFLKAIRDMLNHHRDETAKRDEAIQRITREHNEAFKNNSEAIRENTRVIGENSAELRASRVARERQKV